MGFLKSLFGKDKKEKPTTRTDLDVNQWKKEGVVEGKRWNTAVDELVCPICGPLHNVVVGINETFPGGYQNPPAHPNCRCGLTPVVEGAEERETGLEQFGLRPTATGHEYIE